MFKRRGCTSAAYTYNDQGGLETVINRNVPDGHVRLVVRQRQIARRCIIQHGTENWGRFCFRPL